MNESAPINEPKKGLVQVYTGAGKGKTTAALGLALRAVGQGWRVQVIQFMKGTETGELKAAPLLGENFHFLQCGSGKFMKGRLPTPEELESARAAFNLAEKLLAGPEIDLLILDEISHAISAGLVRLSEVQALLAKRMGVEIVLTGRNMPDQLIETAGLVSRIEAVKHPYESGYSARRGIEY